MEITINGLDFKSEMDVHNYLSKVMNFPEYYGNNLDALWDVLNEVDEPINIKLSNKEDLIKNTDQTFVEGLISVFKDSMDENDNINFKLITSNIRNKS